MGHRQTILIVSMAPGDALRTARASGLRVTLVTNATLTWQSEYIDQLLAVDPYDPSALLETLREQSLASKFAAIVTYDERAVVATAQVAASLGLRSNSVSAAYAARNKLVMREHFLKHGLACPRFAAARTLYDALHFAEEVVKYPLVIKPLFGFASQGVVRIDSPEELCQSLPLISGIAASYAPFVGDDPQRDCLLLEEYMPGREIAVDAILDNGVPRWIGMFDKPNPLEGPTFEETIYVTPSREREDVQQAVQQEVTKGVRALGLHMGAIHAELRITPEGPRLLEIGARPIGGACARAHIYCLGLDYHSLVFASALGHPVEVPRTDKTPSGVMMMPVPGRGQLRSVEGLDEARAVPGVRDVFVLAKLGDTIELFPEQGCYLGFILATGQSPEAVERSLNTAFSSIRFELG